MSTPALTSGPASVAQVAQVAQAATPAAGGAAPTTASADFPVETA